MALVQLQQSKLNSCSCFLSSSSPRGLGPDRVGGRVAWQPLKHVHHKGLRASTCAMAINTTDKYHVRQNENYIGLPFDCRSRPCRQTLHLEPPALERTSSSLPKHDHALWAYPPCRHTKGWRRIFPCPSGNARNSEPAWDSKWFRGCAASKVIRTE